MSNSESYNICETLNYCKETDIITNDKTEIKTEEKLIVTNYTVKNNIDDVDDIQCVPLETALISNDNNVDKENSKGGKSIKVPSDPMLNKPVFKKTMLTKFSSLRYKFNAKPNENKEINTVIAKDLKADDKQPVLVDSESRKNAEKSTFMKKIKDSFFAGKQKSSKNKEKPILLVNDQNVEKNSNQDAVSNCREKWDRKTEFLLAIIGFSVDLGNVWRFPKVVFDNGGGRFMIPYFIQLILCGLPLFYMELVLGQFHQTGVFTLWDKICPLFKGLAFASVVVNLLLAMFYNTIIAWAAYYLYLSFRKVVPWQNCDNPWNTDCCFPLNQINEIMEGKDTYYSKTNSSLLYRRYSNKLILFNFKHLYTTIDQFGEYFNTTPTVLAENALENTNYTLRQSSLESWLKLYYVYFESNGTLINAPNISTNPKLDLDLKFDTDIPIKFIDSYLKSLYENVSHTLILNCSNFTSSPTQEFYSRFLTEMNKSRGLESIGNIKWEIAVCLFFVFVTVYFALWKGIKSAGKAVWITAIAPYIVMIILLIRGLTLEGSWGGIKFYLGVRDWSSIFHYKVWVDAAAQIFFSLGPGFGTIIALASYNKKSNNCYRDALLTSFINCLTSVLSGFVVFATLGHMANAQGKDVENMIVGGPGLVFITYPQAISMMPMAPFWAVIFFFMLFTLGIDSTFGGLESVITGICDCFPQTLGRRRAWFVLFLVTLCYIAALPTVTYGGPYIVHLLDAYAVTPSLMFIALLEIIGVMYFYGYRKFCNDIYQMLQIRPSIFWQICWRYISPLIVIVMTIITCIGMLQEPLGYGEYVYTELGRNLAIVIVTVPLILIVIYIPYKFYVTQGSFIERLRRVTVEPNEQPHNSTNMFVSSLMNRTNQNTNITEAAIVVNTTNDTANNDTITPV